VVDYFCAVFNRKEISFVENLRHIFALQITSAHEWLYWKSYAGYFVIFIITEVIQLMFHYKSKENTLHYNEQTNFEFCEVIFNDGHALMAKYLEGKY
jgi:hypothetical protein